jgi:GPH family glycoside/pentoside/hexuronide:cation symporter
MAKTINFKMLSSERFDSRIASYNVRNKERWLGFFLGPALVICTNAICGQSYLNVFYTDVLKLSPVAGGLFLALMPFISKTVDAITNVIMGRLIDNTRSSQGKARPWILVSGPLMAISAILLFLVPDGGLTMQLVWVTVSYNLYFCVAYTIFNITNMLMVPLSTRNNNQRDTLALVQGMGMAIVPGTLVAMVFPMFILPVIGVDQSKWIVVMSIVGLLCVPATLIQYFFTRERITEETADLDGESGPTMLRQLKACLASRYWVVIIGISILYQLMNNFQVTTLLYYSNWVLGTYNDGSTYTLLNIIGQGPLGFGLIIFWPLVKKFGKRNVTIVGSAISVIGCIICAIFPRDMGMVLAGLFIKSLGSLPMTYIVMAMVADALDHVEWLNKFRCDGFSSAVLSIIYTVAAGISIGLFNFFLGRFGYIPPAADETVVIQSLAVQNLFITGVFIVPAFAYFLVAFMISFFKVEKELPQIRADVLARHKAEAAARGEIYVSPEEKAKIEQDKLDKIAEEKRVEELKAKCSKSGLNFEAEEAKYQKKLAEKKAKAEAKKKRGKNNEVLL